MRQLTMLLAWLGLAVSASAQTLDVDTFAGTVAAPAQPKSVVVLDLAAIDTLDALGITAIAVPDITPPAFLAHAVADLPTVGTLHEPDFEAIAALAPDLIIAGGRSQPKVEALSKIAPTLDMTISTDVVGQGLARLAAYGTLFDKTAEADALAAELTTSIDQTRALATDAGTALVILTNGGKISAYGTGSRFGWLHSSLGLQQAVEGLEVSNHGEAISFEFIAETNPDWLFVIDRGAAIGQEGEAAAATLDTPLVQNTTAGQNGQIVYLDSAALYLSGGGVQSLMATVDEVKTALAAKQGS